MTDREALIEIGRILQTDGMSDGAYLVGAVAACAGVPVSQLRGEVEA